MRESESEKLDTFTLPEHETALVSQDQFNQISVMERKKKKREKKAKPKGLSLAAPSDDTASPSDPPTRKKNQKRPEPPGSEPPLVITTQDEIQAKREIGKLTPSSEAGLSQGKGKGKEKLHSEPLEISPGDPVPSSETGLEVVDVALSIQPVLPLAAPSGSAMSAGPSIPTRVVAEQQILIADTMRPASPMSVDWQDPSQPPSSTPPRHEGGSTSPSPLPVDLFESQSQFTPHGPIPEQHDSGASNDDASGPSTKRRHFSLTSDDASERKKVHLSTLGLPLSNS